MLLRNPAQAQINVPMLDALGTIQLIRQFTRAPGLTLRIDVSMAAINDDQVRELARATLDAGQRIHATDSPTKSTKECHS